MTLERFRALAPEGDRSVYLKERQDRVELCTRTGYRAFAAWLRGGDQLGLHVRGASGTPSTAFRGKDSNWIYVGEQVDWDGLSVVLDAARGIAKQRGGGRSSVALELYLPLEKAVKLLSERPPHLHAGGPRAKILSGEWQVCAALATACAERVRPIDPALAKRCEANAKGARSAGAMSCKSYATSSLVDTIAVLEASDPAQATAFAGALDELILRHEFVAAFAKFAKGDPPELARVLWRAADPKGYPGYWLVRLADGQYGLLAKLGGRWGWHVADRNNTLATVPDELLDAASQMTLARDA